MALTETDRKLLSRCLAGEPAGWKDFIDRFNNLFLHVIRHTAEVRSVPISNADVEDFCADVFLQIVDRDAAVLRQFRGKSSLSTYLAVVTRRIVVREMARRRKLEGKAGENGGPRGLPDGFVPPLAGNPGPQQIDDSDELQKLLSELPPGEAEIVRLFHLEGKTYQEISDSLGIKENSIGPTLHRAREQLRSRKVSL